ncbi:hypothetical protein [Mycobacterium avium]
MTNPDPANPTPRRRRWVKPALIAGVAAAVIGGGIAAWQVSRPADPEPPAAVFHSEDYGWSEEELEPWLQEQVSSGFLTPLPDAVAPAPCAENPDQGLCRLSEIMRGTDR